MTRRHDEKQQCRFKLAHMMNLDQFNIPRYLATLPLFSQLDQGELERVAAGCTLRRFERGKLVFRQGEPCDKFHVVITGQVKLFVLSATGAEKIVSLCGPDHTFAEAIMFIGKPYVVSAQTLSETLLLSVERHTVLDEIANNPGFALRMLAGLSWRLHGLIKDVEGYALQSGVQRVIGYLLGDHIDESEIASESITVTLPVSKAAIASRLSLTPEYFSRVFNELETAGLIRVDKRNIHIPDTARLATYQPK
jgi:CRP-like cAMP-binding protein